MARPQGCQGSPGSLSGKPREPVSWELPFVHFRGSPLPTEYNHKSRLKPVSDVPGFRTVKVGICKLSFPARIDLISWFCVSYPGHTLDGLLCWVPWRTLSVMSAGHHPPSDGLAPCTDRSFPLVSPSPELPMLCFGPCTSHSGVSLSPGQRSEVPAQVLTLALLWVCPTPHSSEVSTGFPGFFP